MRRTLLFPNSSAASNTEPQEVGAVTNLNDRGPRAATQGTTSSRTSPSRSTASKRRPSTEGRNSSPRCSRRSALPAMMICILPILMINAVSFG
ncbi:unnamed protein product [Dicrocoelium dendriticum]|nr:unnamed protein product [Dicrocoelium dendriticum]